MKPMPFIQNIPANMDKFSRFSSLYTSSRRYGADYIFRCYLSFPGNWPVPFSIAHGVDSGQFYEPFDVKNIEPIHWCTNEIVYEKAIRYKPSVLMPHPWVIVYSLLGSNAGTPSSGKVSRLIVLPPPGSVNDMAVVDWMERHGLEGDVLLVKPRGSYSASIEFFRAQGFSVECIASTDKSFYFSLFSLLQGCSSVLGLTASSFLFFSASMGVPTSVADDFFYSAYDVLGSQDIQDYTYPLLREFILSCLNNNHAKSKKIASEVLGENHFIEDLEKRRLPIIKSCNSVEIPYFLNCSLPRYLPRALNEALALATGKQGLLANGLRTSIERFFRQKIGKTKCILFRMNEIDCILNGRSDANFSFSRVDRGEPGHGF
jgi:hypothetical protein